MQYLFASHVPLSPTTPDGVPATDAAATCMAEWVRQRFGAEIDEWSEGFASSGEASLRWELMEGDPGALIRLDIDHPDRAVTDFRWSTTVWVAAEAGGAWFRVRVGLQSGAAVVVDPHVEVGRPGVLRRLIDRLDPSVDGLRLGAWTRIRGSDVERYLALLSDSARRLPIVAVTRGAAPPPVHPDRLTDRLLGLAHVVAVDPDATYLVADAVAPARSAYGGAIRVYWPRFTAGCDPYDHPLWTPRSLEYLGTDRFERELVALLGRVAATSLGVPVLEGALRRERTRLEADQRRAESAQLVERLRAEAAARSEGGVDADTWEEFSREYDGLDARARQLEEENLELQLQLQQEREDRERAEQNARLAWRQATKTSEEEPLEQAPQEMPVTTVEQAVRRAKDTCPNLVILDEALGSATESRYRNPEQVLEDLRMIDEVAGLWRADQLDGDFRAAFAARTSAFRNGISDTAANMFPADYRRTHEGETIMLGPHLARGVGAPNEILRIYWYPDPDTRRFVVGHVGRKLRDDSNR